MPNWLGKLLRKTTAGGSPSLECDDLVREALAQQQAGRLDEAERKLYRALALEPASAAVHLHLGNLFRQLGRHDTALNCCLEAVRLAPDLPQGHNNLGNAYQDLGQLEAAIAEFGRAIALDGGLAEAHFNLGLAYHLRGDHREAARSYRAALRVKPDFADAQLNLGNLLEEEGDVQAAILSYRRAVAVEPGRVEAHVNLGMQLLLAGRYAEGWQEYEWRQRYPEYASSAAVAARWDGGALEGKRILLDTEQGFGDAIQFLRYAPLVAQRGGQVVVRCAPELASLFRRTEGIRQVILRDTPPPAFDAHCPLPSLPLVFGTELASIPARVPYVSAEPGQIAHWRTKLAASAGAFKVGLVWASQSKHRTAAAKSFPLTALGPLAAIPGVRYFSLQKGEAARQAGRPPEGLKIEYRAVDLRDFSDTAAAIANLDLVISVDTAVAHLAGALGRPVWTLLKYAPDWRWLLARDDSPWYPTMRLFRQKVPSNWSSVIEDVARALQKLAERAPR